MNQSVVNFIELDLEIWNNPRTAFLNLYDFELIRLISESVTSEVIILSASIVSGSLNFFGSCTNFENSS